jgi:hypothetical protein
LIRTQDKRSTTNFIVPNLRYCPPSSGTSFSLLNISYRKVSVPLVALQVSILGDKVYCHENMLP